MSTSFTVYEFLKGQEPGYTFTAEQLYNIVSAIDPEVTIGGVGGFCSRARSVGHLDAVSDGKTYTYILKDLDGLIVKRSRGAGGAPGRKSSGSSHLKANSVRSIQERLLELAAELENARSPLADYSTDDLLSELMRRQRTANKAGA